MKTKLTIIGLLVAVKVSAQTLAVFPGVNYGRFYSTEKLTPHYGREYKPQYGYSFGIEIRDVALDTLLKVTFAVNYQNYGGYFYTRGGSFAGSIYDEGKITKDVLGLEFYPINLKFFREKMRLSLGMSFNALLSYRMSGEHSWFIGAGNVESVDSGTKDLNAIDGFVKPYYWGVNSSLGYAFEIGKIRIEPRYVFYGGLSEEFNDLQVATKSMRHSFQVVVGWKNF